MKCKVSWLTINFLTSSGLSGHQSNIGHLGKSEKGSDRQCFERLQLWFKKIPMAFTEMIERFE